MARLLACERHARYTSIRGARTRLSRDTVHLLSGAHRQVPGSPGPVTDLVSSAVNRSGRSRLADCTYALSTLWVRRQERHPDPRRETLRSTRGQSVVVR